MHDVSVIIDATSARGIYVVVAGWNLPEKGIRGHPFMTSTRRAGQAQIDASGREGGPAPCGRPHRKLKLESTDVILYSSRANKLASFLPEFRLWTEKSGNFSAILISDINY